jgi:hypothetical protein
MASKLIAFFSHSSKISPPLINSVFLPNTLCVSVFHFDNDMLSSWVLPYLTTGGVDGHTPLSRMYTL